MQVQERQMDRPGPPVLVKRYAGQRAFRPASGAGLTRNDFIAKVGKGASCRRTYLVGKRSQGVGHCHRLARSTSLSTDAMPGPEAPIVIKRYANGRLYNTGPAAYASLDGLTGMDRLGADFIVCDAGTGEDITRSIPSPITTHLTEH
jgi:polyhydroxyalkanoate synthesis regulator protein